MQGRTQEAPLLPGTAVDRGHLLDQLDEITSRRVTVVCAPAGSGKTTLLSQWVRQRTTRQVHWLRAADSAHLHEQLMIVDDAVVVVDGVDSMQLADAALKLATVVAAADRAHLVLSGRYPLPAGLAPLLLGGQAWQLEPTALNLQPDELLPVMQAHARRPLPMLDADAATTQLDGWMAAAALTAIAHRGSDVSADELFAAAEETIEAYVVAEVLPGIDAHLRRLVLATACVEVLHPALCDAITGRDDGAVSVAELRSTGFPIVRLPHGVRVFRPVRDVLDAIARREQPARHAQALRAASEWYSAAGMPFQAASCLARLGAWDEIIPVVLHHLPQILERDEIGRLADLIKHAPDHVLRSQAALALGGSWVLRMDGRVSAAVQLLNVYEPHMDDQSRMIADIGRASVASWTDDMAAADAFADKAVAAGDELGGAAFAKGVYRRLLPQSFGEDSTDVYRTFAHGAGLLACTYGGMWKHALDHLIELDPDTIVRMPQIRAVEQRGIRATFYALSGQAAEAELEANAGLTNATQAALTDNRASADAFFALGEAHRLQLRPSEAGELFEQAQPLAELNERRNLIGTIVAARAHLAIGGGAPELAASMLEKFRRRYPQRLPATVAGLLAAADARALIAVGRYHAAVRALESTPLTPPSASARVAALLGAGDVTSAQHTVRDWPVTPTVDSVVRRAIAAAVICDHTGDRRRASLLRTAFDAARPHRLIQPFTEFGADHARLLRNASKADTPFGEEIQRWLADDTTLIDAPRLTARETTIMSHLADGRKAREIAADLHLSLNTVRTHARTAYRKLGVNNRADAVRVWRRTSAAEDRSRR